MASAQTVGSEIFSSIEVSSRRSRGASKILPQFADFFADWGVLVFEVGEHWLILVHLRGVGFADAYLKRDATALKMGCDAGLRMR